MTVNSENIVAGPYIGTGLSDTFSYGFQIQADDQLAVYETDSDGVRTPLVLDTDYTVTGVGDEGGGTIVRTAGALPADYTIFIMADYQATQETEFESQGRFRPQTHEKAFDKLTFLVKQLKYMFDTTLQLPPGYSGNSPVLPDPEAGDILRWTEDGIEGITVGEILTEIGTIIGDLGMNNNRITDVANAIEAGDAVNLAQVSELLFNSGVDGVLPVVHPRQIGDNSTTVFSTPATGTANTNASAFFVTLSGVPQRPATDFTIDQTTGNLTFLQDGVTYAPATNAKIDITYFNPYTFDTDDDTLIIATGTTTPRTLGDRFADVINVKDFGAIGDGIADDTSSISAMQAALGYVRLPIGTFNCNTFEFTGNLKFDEGAKLVASNGETVTIRGLIEAGEWHVLDYDGTGTYIIGNDSVRGENSRDVKASWFGVFPSPQFIEDQTPAINRIFQYLGNTRESVVEFQMGNYHQVTGPVLITRGGWVKGHGQRRTVFKAYADGFDQFVTDNVACRFTDIQQELDLASITDRTNGAFIRILHDHCDIDNVSVSTGREIIVVEDNDVRITNILCTFNGNNDAGSCIVSVRSGSGCYINGIEMSGTTGPESIVNIGENATGTISGTTVNNIRCTSNSRAVTLKADSTNITRISINKAQVSPFTGTPQDSVVNISTSGSGNIDFVDISHIMSSSLPVNGVVIDQNSTGKIDQVFLDKIILPSLSGAGLKLTRTNGALTNINSDVCNYKDCATPVSQTGSMDKIRLNPLYQSLPAQTTFAYELAIDDDSFAEIPLNRSVFSGLATIVAGSARYGLFAFRAASSPSVVNINSAANVVAVNTALNGTTGSDGNITLGVTNGVLYVENRSGGTQPISLGIITGQTE